MMGSVDNKGIIPRLCDQLFENIAANPDPSICFKVEVSYMEIYNEKVRDLLDPNGWVTFSGNPLPATSSHLTLTTPN